MALLLLGLKRVFGFFVEFVLEFEAGVVGFDGTKGFDDGTYPRIDVPLAEFFCGDGAVTGIVIWKTGVPPNTGVDIFGKFDATLIGAGFLFGAIEVHEIGTSHQRVGSFVLASLVIYTSGFFRAAARTVA